MDSSVSPKDEIWFLRVCHHISNAVYRCKEHFSFEEQLPQNTGQREGLPLATEVARSAIYGRQLCRTCCRPLHNFKTRTKRRVSQPCNLSTHSIFYMETSCCVPIVRGPSIPLSKHNSEPHRFSIPSTTVFPRLCRADSYTF